MARGMPRLDRYLKLIARFFESVVVLFILGRVQGPHLATIHDSSSATATRRRFLRNLCVACDYTKGGQSTTAIAIEDCEDCIKFWVASNEGPGTKVTSFLSCLLSLLKRLSGVAENERKNNEVEALREVLHVCTKFASIRLKKRCKELSTAARRCRMYLQEHPQVDDADILSWLQQFEFKQRSDVLTMCETAYRCRHDKQMHSMAHLSREPEDGSSRDEIATAFARVQHVIGRLAAHVRVPQQLLNDSGRLQSLLDVVTVTSVETPPAVSIPPPDSHTNLAGILGRLLPKSDSRFRNISGTISNFAEQIGLEEGILSIWTKHSFVPFVHAEVQLLEKFYRDGRVYVANDPYIACSKLACFCCKLYFQYHPAKCVQPDSHQKLYMNWSPPFLPGGSSNELWFEQRKLLNSMIHDIREAVLERMQRSNVYQPDSLAEITESVGTMTSLSSSEAEFSNDSHDDHDDEDDAWSCEEVENAADVMTTSLKQEGRSIQMSLNPGNKLEMESESDSDGGAPLND